MSSNGWVRAAKGHDIEPDKLPYRAGDGYLSSAKGKSNQPALFLDSAGRTYALPVHTLPSARGHGEPLTGRLHLPPQAVFKAVLVGEPQQLVLMASDAGYGFVTELSNLFTKNQKGKALLSLPKGALPLPPVYVDDPRTDLLAAVTSEGRMLVFALRELPLLPKGKGNKIIHIPAARARDRSEVVTVLTLVAAGATVTVHAGRQFLKLSQGNLNDYMGERGRRGKKLPRGYRKVDRIETELPAQLPLLYH